MKNVHAAFTMPENEYKAIQEIRSRCMKLGLEANKSEVIRCGLIALEALSDSEFKQIVSSLPRTKTGRPARSKAK